MGFPSQQEPPSFQLGGAQQPAAPQTLTFIPVPQHAGVGQQPQLQPQLQQVQGPGILQQQQATKHEQQGYQQLQAFSHKQGLLVQDSPQASETGAVHRVNPMAEGMSQAHQAHHPMQQEGIAMLVSPLNEEAEELVMEVGCLNSLQQDR
jgi:hypothetical protein